MRRKIGYLVAAVALGLTLQWAVPSIGSNSVAPETQEAARECPATKQCPTTKDCPEAKQCPKAKDGQTSATAESCPHSDAKI